MTVDHIPIQKSIFNKNKKIISIFIGTRNVLAFFGVIILFVLIFQIPKYLYEPTKKIELNGNRLISDQRILELLDLNQNQPWIELDPYFLILRLEKPEWIEHALVQRRIPLGLEIQIVEKIPLAILKTGEQLLLLGKDLHVLPYITNKESWNLPVIVYPALKQTAVGDKIDNTAVRRAVRLMELLEKNNALPLSAISEIHIDKPLNIQLVTIPDGIRINLGYDNYKTKLLHLAASLSKIKSIRNEIEYIDLRSNRGVVIRKFKNR